MSGKKGRKTGHNKTRSQSMANYRATGRMFTNKKRRVMKAAQFRADCADAREAFRKHLNFDFEFKMGDVCRCVRMYKRGEFN